MKQIWIPKTIQSHQALKDEAQGENQSEKPKVTKPELLKLANQRICRLLQETFLQPKETMYSIKRYQN